MVVSVEEAAVGALELGPDLYAIVDPCGLPGAMELLHSEAAAGKAVGLYQGLAAENFIDKAPFLVRVDAGCLASVLALANNEAWGILLRSRVGIVALAAHLRRLVRVTSPAGQDWLFRFYDPRLLPVFLQACTASEAQQFFGPIDRFIVYGNGIPSQQLSLTDAQNFSTEFPGPPWEKFRIHERHLRGFRSIANAQVPAVLLARGRESGHDLRPDSTCGDLVCFEGGIESQRLSFSTEHLPSQLILPSGGKYLLEANQHGHLGAVTAPGGARIELQYDERARLSRIARRDSPGSSFVHDDADRLIEVGHADQTRTRLTYGRASLAEAVTDRTGAVTRYEYTKADLLHAVVDPLGRRLEYVSDEDGRLSAVRFPDGTCEEFKYDPEARRGVFVARDGRQTVRLLDQKGYLSEVHSTDGSHVRYEVDSSGRLLAVTEGDAKIERDYDAAGRISAEMSDLGTIGYEYDVGGRLTKLILDDGTWVSYGYDVDGHVSRVNDSRGARIVYHSPCAGSEIMSRIEYGDDLAEVRDHTDAGRLAASELITSYGRSLGKRQYSYDSCDRVISSLEVDEEQRIYERSFRYDAEGRLLEATEFEARRPRQVHYVYDAKGNLLRADGRNSRFGSMDQPLSFGQQLIEYDSLGNMVGLPGPEGELCCSFTANGMLRQVRVGGKAISFTYDPLGRRKSKTDGESTWRYSWSGHQLISEVLTKGLSSRPNARRDYIYLPDGHTPVAFREGAELFWMQQDARGAVTSVIDSRGCIVWHADYDAFGGARIDIAHVRQPWRLDGQYEDDETRLHFNCNRYYSPYIRSYLSRDPQWFRAGATFYSYCANDPWNRTDPLGGFWHIIGGAVIGAVTGGIVAAYRGENVWAGALEGGVVGAAFAVNPVLGAATLFGADVLHQGIENGWDNICWLCAGGVAAIGLLGGWLLGKLFKAAARGLGALFRRASGAVASWARSALSRVLQAVVRVRAKPPFPSLWSAMSRAEQRAFQHAYGRHAAEFGLPKWSQSNAELLRQQFNQAVENVRRNAQKAWITNKPVGTRGSGIPGSSKRVIFLQYTDPSGVKYFYYETLTGRFVSSGLQRP